MKGNPWNAVLLTYRQTGKLLPCPYCSQDMLTVEKDISCAHIALYLYCSSCGKWTYVDG